MVTHFTFLSGWLDIVMLRPCLMYENLRRLTEGTKEGAAHMFLVAKTSNL